VPFFCDIIVFDYDNQPQHDKKGVSLWYRNKALAQNTNEGSSGRLARRGVRGDARAHELKETCETPQALAVMSLVFGVHPRVRLRKVRSFH